MNLVYTWCVTRVDPEKREQWEGDMDAPLPWEIRRDKAPTPEQLEREGQDFMAFMNAQSTGA